ncbi:3-hydroxyacyl-CoA dehydrogenase NAD-binding domain-containing protein [Marinospirillum sp.]|uniref:3-hydroxyacyl-CoA dehydrogenase NAD-binding domain-containing protein n=1 Tax=Marinospirillum sp. TaxID=2183934 RepID=UPI00287012D0|nr:3-hydroxyacyl-CoA dehydrogenase NAD-binding domain-containing protein [Marinospirillum sp.]MDR9467895.1 3-hydroxyacyl-CoA dehydrogenase NAD-binding domain-containing protein [Marinospirillum sp.]
MSETVKYEQQGNIALITVNNPPVNALSASVRQGLVDAFSRADQETAIEGVVLACEGRTFIAGADISEFGKPMQSPALPEVLAALNAMQKPTVAALHGTALGGGLETALSCHYRIALTSAAVGLPEVKLGLLPGSGGTQRLPRLIGADKALDLITSGRKAKAEEAAKMGLIDRLVEDKLETNAIAYARELAESQAELRRCQDMQVDTSSLPTGYFTDYKKGLAKKMRGFEAPLACVDTVEYACTLPFEQGLEKERELFLQLMNSTQSAAQRHLFFAERKAAVVDDLPKKTATREINKVAVIGAGTMGAGIAMCFSNAGIPVVMLELKQEALDRGLTSAHSYYADRKAKGRMSPEQADQAAARITGTLSYDDLGEVDLVIEAVFESMDIKHQVFRELDRVCKPGAILSTNTSTLNVDEIAAVTKRPEDVLGLHFFSPAQVMRLLEVVRGEKTSDEVLATAMQLAGRISKVGVVSGVCDGFIGNRMLKGYSREAGALLLEGATPPQIDKVMYDFGMAMGPMTMGDLAGLDVGYRVRQERRQRGDDIPPTEGAVADRLVELGRCGQKTGKGYYRYEEGSRKPIPDPEVEEVIAKTSAELGIQHREISDNEIIERLIYPLINEAALILEEGFAQRPSDIDIVWIYGYGFPVYRGGPMFYADTVGLDKVLDSIKTYQKHYGDAWKPAPLLEKLAAEGKKFADL